MRENHKKMPEIIDASEEVNHYMGVVEIEIDYIYKKFQFGISHNSYHV